MARVKIDMPAAFAFSTSIPVRITDVNYGGHLGNDAIVSILHESRMQYLRSLGCSELEFFGTGLIMSDLAIVYKGEGFYGDTLTVEVTAGELSSVGFDLFYRLSTTRDGKILVIAEAKTGMVCFDYQARKVARLPEPFKQQTSNTTA
ncbi:acyl-CoA thioesterase [Chitinophaga sp. GCM10012297]|uniref:Thioesterase family protein n=1 Tax=Chitinophaga chungangae TaxID=2821488 RepID=A0ABS3Y867_9BACT|nr:thioesterase family protein [Chitinophaga chungangae]MBO9150860.1 thioesterase family protein [Chitinophaga chungangae]